jgi:hypothetical protein
LQIEAVNLHNAGNDAVYTMQALVKMAAPESNEPRRLAELLCMVKGKPLEKYDDTIVAPTVWGGTAVVGDERSIVWKKYHGPGKGKALRQRGGQNSIENSPNQIALAQWTSIANSLPSAIALWNDLLLHRSDTLPTPFGSLTTSNATVVAYETAGVWDKPSVPPDGPDSFLRPSSYTVAAPLWTGQPLVPIMGTAMPGSMPLAGTEGEITELFVIAGWQFKQEEILNTELIDWP